MMKVMAGMFFGIFFVAPALSYQLQDIDTSGMSNALMLLGVEVKDYFIDVVKGLI